MMVFPSYVMSSVIGFSLLSPSPVHLNVVGFPASTFDEHCKIIFMDRLFAPTLLCLKSYFKLKSLCGPRRASVSESRLALSSLAHVPNSALKGASVLQMTFTDHFPF